MAYTGDPSNNTLDAVYLEIGLTDPTISINLIDDTEIQYFLDKNSGSVRKASLDAAKSVLFRLSFFIRERADVLEIYGSDYFKQYSSALKTFISNPEYGSISVAMPYAGGISRSDIRANLIDEDTFAIQVEKGIPTEYDAYNVNNTSPFTESNLPRTGNFEI